MPFYVYSDSTKIICNKFYDIYCKIGPDIWYLKDIKHKMRHKPKWGKKCFSFFYREMRVYLSRNTQNQNEFKGVKKQHSITDTHSRLSHTTQMSMFTFKYCGFTYFQQHYIPTHTHTRHTKQLKSILVCRLFDRRCQWYFFVRQRTINPTWFLFFSAIQFITGFYWIFLLSQCPTVALALLLFWSHSFFVCVGNRNQDARVQSKIETHSQWESEPAKDRVKKAGTNDEKKSHE